MITALCSVSNEYKLTFLLHGMYVVLSLQMPNGRATYSYTDTEERYKCVVTT
jgi:hypothetical protein